MLLLAIFWFLYFLSILISCTYFDVKGSEVLFMLHTTTFYVCQSTAFLCINTLSILILPFPYFLFILVDSLIIIDGSWLNIMYT